MKKQYIKPQASVVVVDTTAILAASNTDMVDSRPKSDVSDPSTTSDNQFSKQNSFNVWEDE